MNAIMMRKWIFILLLLPAIANAQDKKNFLITGRITSVPENTQVILLGFNGTDLKATIDLQKTVHVGSVTASFLCDPNSAIFLPPSVSVYVSADGQHFDLVGEWTNTAGNIRGEPYLHKVRIQVGRSARYVRVVAKAFGQIPEGYLFKGSTSWLFADEVLVE